MKRIRRSKEFEVNLTITDDKFINPPRDMQRNTMVNRAIKEFSADLVALDTQAKNFVPGETVNEVTDRTQAELSDQQIMEDWQIPLMQAMARVVCGKGGDILELGFGRGIASDMIQSYDVSSHVIMECNEAVIERYNVWKGKYPGKDIQMVKGLWQDTIDDVGLFDGVFFHTYPLNQEEYMKYVNESITFAAHFFPDAAKHLKPGGSFSYFSNEIDSLSREHQRQLLKHFSSFQIEKVTLEIPEDVHDMWWSDTMIVVKAIK
ncbi:class I SAM-dependent methyltransferase [Aurantibacter crassamenti]|uniref:class I SAM-dependent methyltransferase n=1 Tax=Aurantibacter crassamenti TaxID=1837375 RepID=UPI00193AADE6|nr:class I SAM-dependent methyltransferase [Aurantibacter crassamenti]MBM1106810.1 class I SAM-dependent methyltransferase [Aurantibacter crassamenti]